MDGPYVGWVKFTNSRNRSIEREGRPHARTPTGLDIPPCVSRDSSTRHTWREHASSHTPTFLSRPPSPLMSIHSPSAMISVVGVALCLVSGDRSLLLESSSKLLFLWAGVYVDTMVER